MQYEQRNRRANGENNVVKTALFSVGPDEQAHDEAPENQRSENESVLAKIRYQVDQ